MTSRVLIMVLLVAFAMTPPPAASQLKAIAFIKIPAGEFVMGSATGLENEKPAHRVVISRDFEIGKYEVTQAEWESVMGSNPSHFKGADLESRARRPPA